MASPDNALGTSVNPSSLGALSSWSLAYSHVDTDRGLARETSYRDRFDGAWLAAPFGRSFALGTGMEFARARDGSYADSNGFVLGAALSAGPSASFGATWRLRSPYGVSHAEPDLHTADLAVTLRPSPMLAISGIARDLARHTPRLGERPVREAGLIAIAVRPVRDDRLVLELAGKADAGGDLGLRMVAQGKLPKLGRLAFAGELGKRDGREIWTLTAGVDVRWQGVSLAPAALFDDESEHAGWSLLGDLHGDPRIGLPAPLYIAKLTLKALGPRSLIAAERQLERLLHDPRVQGLVLELDGTDAGLSTAQDLRLLVNAFEQAGKPVYCFLESASGSEYYACAGARRIAIDPAGLIRLMGVGGDAFFLGGLLRNIGVRADFVRIGRYKSAPEQYTNSESSDATKEVRRSLLDGAYRRLTSDLSGDLGKDEAALRELIDRGPFLAPKAVQERLVQAALDRRDIPSDGKEVFGPSFDLHDPQATAREPAFGAASQIGVVVIDGTIVDGENVDVPFLNVHMSGGRTVSDAIDRLAADSRIRAIVLRIDSPGGAVIASDQIWRAVRRARAKKPVIASMGEVAASGGYFVAAGADEIWAEPSTITGSIGIFYGKVDVGPLAEKLGVTVESDRRGKHAGANSLFRPFTDEERLGLAEMLRTWYRQFLERVSEGRKLPIERVDALARGRVYSGDEAQALGLVDSLGGFTSALMRARQLANLERDAELVVVPKVPSNLLEYVFGVDPRAQAMTAIPAELRAVIGRVYPMLVLGSAPLALYEGPLSLD
ncbi:MAG TPA: signal peptide peptidase SppA [Polyangiales bacterium]|nr:signal peptide peptidase SppA [Polyangiales bacterium]